MENFIDKIILKFWNIDFYDLVMGWWRHKAKIFNFFVKKPMNLKFGENILLKSQNKNINFFKKIHIKTGFSDLDDVIGLIFFNFFY